MLGIGFTNFFDNAAGHGAEHSQDRTLASHRPDKRDKEQLSSMAHSIIEKVCEADAKHSPLPSFNVDTTTPYRERSKVKAIPKLLDSI